MSEQNQNQSYLEKAINTSLGGQLNAEDTDTFFDSVRDKSGWMSKLQWIGTDAGSVDLQNWDFKESDVLQGSEGTTPTHLGSGSIDERTITLTEAVLGYDLTYNFLNYNIMGDNVDGYIQGKMATVFKNVIARNTVTGSTVNGTRQYGIFDGLLLNANADSNTVSSFTTASATNPYEVALRKAYDSLDDKFKDSPEDELVYLVPYGFASGWKKEAGDRATARGDQYKFSKGVPDYWGIPVVSVRDLEFNFTVSGSTEFYGDPVETEIVLTAWDNLKVGYSNRYGQFGVGIQDQPRKRLVEYTLNAYLGMNHIDGARIVINRTSGSLA